MVSVISFLFIDYSYFENLTSYPLISTYRIQLLPINFNTFFPNKLEKKLTISSGFENKPDADKHFEAKSLALYSTRIVLPPEWFWRL
jgi:hypothetical protein